MLQAYLLIIFGKYLVSVEVVSHPHFQMLEWHNRAEIEPHHHSPLMVWLSLTPPVLMMVSHNIARPFFSKVLSTTILYYRT